MPVIKSAQKKLRQDKKRTVLNKKFENSFKKLVKKAEKSPSDKSIKEAMSAIDKAAKKNIIHKNKAARLKSNLSKFLKKDKKIATKSLKASPKASLNRKTNKK